MSQRGETQGVRGVVGQIKSAVERQNVILGISQAL
jgi:hypothetical protein